MILATGSEDHGVARPARRTDTSRKTKSRGDPPGRPGRGMPRPYSMLYAQCTKGQHGAALVIALIVMTMLSMLAIGSLEMLTLNIQIASNHMHDLQALYIADAGMEDAIMELRSDSSWDTGFTDKEFPVGSGNTYTVTIDNSDSPSIVITSTGIVSDFQRSLEAQVEITGASAPYTVEMAYWKET
jgi:Tfp pilus assembly protein PilX